MPTKRITLTDDVERLADTIRSQFPGIQTEDDFNKAFQSYLDQTLTSDQDNRLRPKVKEEFNKLKPLIKLDTFKEAGGKDFKRDRKKTSKRIVTSVDEYVKQGAKNVDLKGYDTKRTKQTFNVLGKVKGKVIFSRADFIILNKKRVIRYRDRKGRFVSVKKLIK